MYKFFYFIFRHLGKIIIVGGATYLFKDKIKDKALSKLNRIHLHREIRDRLKDEGYEIKKNDITYDPKKDVYRFTATYNDKPFDGIAEVTDEGIDVYSNRLDA